MHTPNYTKPTIYAAIKTTGTKVEIVAHDILVENGQPVVYFFTKEVEKGCWGLFSQHELTQYAERY